MRAEGRLLIRIFQAFRGENRNAEPFGGTLHRRRQYFQPAPSGRPWRLGIDRDDVVAGRMQRLKRRRRIVRRPHEDDAHGISLKHIRSEQWPEMATLPTDLRR